MSTIDQYLDAAGLVAQLIAMPEVARAWEQPSTLPGYGVGGLAAHLARSVHTVDAYLHGDPPAPDAQGVDAPGYYVAVLGDHDPRTSDFHAEVRSRGEGAASAGPAAVCDELAAALDRVRAGLRQPGVADRLIAVLGGIAMPVAAYLETRLVELCVHGSDLAASVRVPEPAFGDDAWSVVARVASELAARRASPRTVALGLARPDDHPRPVAF